MHKAIQTHPVLQNFLENQLTQHINRIKTGEPVLKPLHDVSDCCGTDSFMEGYNTVCACCGFNCELVKP